MAIALKILESICVSRPDANFNEDGLFTSSNLVMVLDGATGLDKSTISNQSDAHWFVCQITNYFQTHFHSQSDFLATLRKSILEARNKIDERTLSHLNTFNMPSAGMSALHIKNGEIKVYRTGDCKIHIKENENIREVFENTKLFELDRESIKVMSAFITAGKTPQQARDQTIETLRKNRSKMNKPDGYNVLSLDPSSINLIESKNIEYGQFELALLSTDGFYSIFETYKEKYINDVFKSLENKQSKKIIKKIRQIENDDNSFKKFPRLKKSDDATAALVSVK